MYFLCVYVCMQNTVRSVVWFGINVMMWYLKGNFISKLKREISVVCLASWVSEMWWVEVEDDLQWNSISPYILLADYMCANLLEPEKLNFHQLQVCGGSCCYYQLFRYSQLRGTFMIRGSKEMMLLTAYCLLYN